MAVESDGCTFRMIYTLINAILPVHDLNFTNPKAQRSWVKGLSLAELGIVAALGICGR